MVKKTEKRREFHFKPYAAFHLVPIRCPYVVGVERDNKPKSIKTGDVFIDPFGDFQIDCGGSGDIIITNNTTGDYAEIPRHLYLGTHCVHKEST